MTLAGTKTYKDKSFSSVLWRTDNYCGENVQSHQETSLCRSPKAISSTLFHFPAASSPLQVFVGSVHLSLHLVLINQVKPRKVGIAVIHKEKGQTLVFPPFTALTSWRPVKWSFFLGLFLHITISDFAQLKQLPWQQTLHPLDTVNKSSSALAWEKVSIKL